MLMCYYGIDNKYKEITLEIYLFHLINLVVNDLMSISHCVFICRLYSITKQFLFKFQSIS